MKAAHHFDDSRVEIYKYLQTVNTDSAKIVFCERFDEKSNIWNFNPHMHSHTEFIYILDGNMQINMADRKLFARPYNMIVYPKNVVHREVLNIQEHQYIICIGIATDEPCPVQTAFEIDDSNGIFRWIMGQIYAEHSNKGQCSEEMIKHYISLLFLHMTRYYSNANEKNHDFISRCINYIHDHFLEELTIEQLSAVAFVSPSHLTRIFRQRTGYSPLAYVRAYRLSIAKHELLLSQYSIEKIAQLSGLHDAKYFSRFFKAETGMTPRDYRKKELAGSKGKGDSEKEE